MLNLDLGTAINIDLYLFLGTLVAGFIISFRQEKSLRLFIILYVLATYSSYNMMIKPIHDYNLITPRTFLFHYQIFGLLNIFDMLFLLYFAYSVLVKKKTGHPSVEIKMIALRDISVAAISLISFTVFYLNYDYLQAAKWSDEIRPLRGILYFTVMLIVFSRLKVELKSSFPKLFSIFISLDLINFASGFVASLLYSNYAWERYGFKISIIDQDDVYTIAITYVAFFALWFFYPSRPRNMYYFVASAIISVLVLLNFYKFHYVAIFILFSIYAVILTLRKKPPLAQVAVLVVFLIAAIPTIQYFYNSKAIETRGGQLSDYSNAMFSGSSYIPLLGMGNGGYYKIISDTSDDGGEIKTIDSDVNSTIRKYIQFPLISLIKPIGVIGLLAFTMFTLVIGFVCLNKKSKITDLVIFSISAYPILAVMLGPIMLSAIPNQSIVFFKCVLLLFAYKQSLESSKS